MIRLRPRKLSAGDRVDLVMAESRQLRSEARALDVRTHLWELHALLRIVTQNPDLTPQRSERIGSSRAARRAGM